VEKSQSVLNPRDAAHEQVMRSILKGIQSSPLVLKGGTALLLAYESDRFSEDLDFDSPQKHNLEPLIVQCIPPGITLDGIDRKKDTATVTRYRVQYHTEHGARTLLLEVSYRTPVQELDVRVKNGFKVASLPRLVDQKLKAAHDGDKTRTAIRDLYDLDFLTRRWPVVLTMDHAERLLAFTNNPDGLKDVYQFVYEYDEIISKIVDLEELVLRLHCNAEEIAVSRSEVMQKINDLPRLKNTAGASYTFWEYAQQAIETAQGGKNAPFEADWNLVERQTIQESLIDNGQPLETVLEVLHAHSPGAVTSTRKAELRTLATKIASTEHGASQETGYEPA
jgi:hypothetical protein